MELDLGTPCTYTKCIIAIISIKYLIESREDYIRSYHEPVLLQTKTVASHRYALVALALALALGRLLLRESHGVLNMRRPKAKAISHIYMNIVGNRNSYHGRSRAKAFAVSLAPCK